MDLKEKTNQPTFESLVELPSNLVELGTGNGITVFRFEQPVQPTDSDSLNPAWAVKCTVPCNSDEGAVERISKRLLHEAEILRSLDHPNVVGFRGWKILRDGTKILAMEECSSCLADILLNRYKIDAKVQPLPANQITKMCLDICSALDYLHNTAHWLHGDLKSYNILVNNDFEICKLCDFGVSLPLNTDGYIDLEKNKDATYIGTDLWSAPETLRRFNFKRISSKADIFSFGLVLYECLTCALPHTWYSLDIATNPVKGRQQLSLPNFRINSYDKDIFSKIDESSAGYNPWLGTRPLLPLKKTLGDEFKTLIEIFYACTNELPGERPSAKCIFTTLTAS